MEWRIQKKKKIQALRIIQVETEHGEHMHICNTNHRVSISTTSVLVISNMVLLFTYKWGFLGLKKNPKEITIDFLSNMFVEPPQQQYRQILYIVS